MADRPELQEKVEGILEAWEEEGEDYITHFSYSGIAYEILAVIRDKLESAIRGKYPQGNSYSDQMERVQEFIQSLNIPKNT